MKHRTGGVQVASAALLALQLLSLPAGADTPPATGYVAPQADAPRRRVGGSSRGVAEALPFVAVIAPDHVGYTLQEQPVLYWFSSRPTTVRVELTLIDEHGVVPLLENVATGTATAGLQRYSLRDSGLKLQPGIDYQWSVSLVPDAEGRSNDVLSAGAIRRVSGDAPEGDAAALAAAGLWYDAFAALSEAIEANPGDAALRQTRQQWLRQIGLGEVADFDQR
ncbi:MAG TPA: DUF928 domain-containing protein [Solimonas sp.]|nr:DUF928 domain-containing protein [Solimonas sp.]